MNRQYRKSSRPFLFIEDPEAITISKKEEIINLAKNGHKRPKAKTDLYKRLVRYTNKSYPKYDEAFTIELKQLRPEWFRSSNENSYNKMLALMPKNVTFKPGQEWNGIAYKYIFVDDELGEFRRTPNSLIYSAWPSGCSGHPRDSYIKKSIKMGVKIKNLDTDEVFDSIKEAGEQLNVSRMGINRALKGKQKKSAGFRWSYLKNS